MLGKNHMITKKQFKDLTGQDPQDVLGTDWKDYIEEYVNDENGNEHFHDGHLAGSCFECKMD